MPCGGSFRRGRSNSTACGLREQVLSKFQQSSRRSLAIWAELGDMRASSAAMTSSVTPGRTSPLSPSGTIYGHATPSAVLPSSHPAGARSNRRHRIPGDKSAHLLAATGPEYAGSGRGGTARLRAAARPPGPFSRFWFWFRCWLLPLRPVVLAEEPDGFGFAAGKGVVEEPGGGCCFVQGGGGRPLRCGWEVVGGVDEQALAGVVEVAASGEQGGIGDAEAGQGVLQGAGDRWWRLAGGCACVTGVLGRSGCPGGVADFPGGGEGAARCVGRCRRRGRPRRRPGGWRGWCRGSG